MTPGSSFPIHQLTHLYCAGLQFTLYQQSLQQSFRYLWLSYTNIILNKYQFNVYSAHLYTIISTIKFIYEVPSSNSKLAPPPVETWDNLSSASHLATAVAVSPPPIQSICIDLFQCPNIPAIVTAPFFVVSITASNTARVPVANFSNSNTPTGLYHISFTESKVYIPLTRSKEWFSILRLPRGTLQSTFHHNQDPMSFISMKPSRIMTSSTIKRTIHPSGIPSASVA